MDFAGPFIGHQFLVLVDAHSKWMEVFPLSSISSTIVIGKLQALFAQLGILQVVVTDNGPSFVSAEFELF